MSYYIEHFGAMLKGHGITRFTPLELCPVGKTHGSVTLVAPPCELWGNIIPTVRIAQDMREHFGKPLTVNSGYRDRLYNRAIGSTDGSMHVSFRALDVRMAGVTPKALYDWLNAHPMSAKLGLGLYSTFVHMDVRGSRARW